VISMCCSDMIKITRHRIPKGRDWRMMMLKRLKAGEDRRSLKQTGVSFYQSVSFVQTRIFPGSHQQRSREYVNCMAGEDDTVAGEFYADRPAPGRTLEPGHLGLIQFLSPVGSKAAMG